MESLFSTAGWLLTDRRAHALPHHIEQQVFLRVNHRFWTVQTIDNFLKFGHYKGIEKPCPKPVVCEVEDSSSFSYSFSFDEEEPEEVSSISKSVEEAKGMKKDNGKDKAKGKKNNGKDRKKKDNGKEKDKSYRKRK